MDDAEFGPDVYAVAPTRPLVPALAPPPDDLFDHPDFVSALLGYEMPKSNKMKLDLQNFVQITSTVPSHATGRYVQYAGAIEFEHLYVQFSLLDANDPRMCSNGAWQIRGFANGLVVYDEEYYGDLTEESAEAHVVRATRDRDPGNFVMYHLPSFA